MRSEGSASRRSNGRQADASATQAPNRIERRKSEFRERITREALKLFARDGVANTSIASIIEAADIAHKTFFNHFPTRDHLLQHIVSSHAEQAYAVFYAAVKHHQDPARQLEYCLMQIAAALEPLDSRRFRELVTFYFTSSASTREFRDAQKRNFSALIRQILTEAKSRNRLKAGCSVDVLNDMIVGICVATLLNWAVEEDYPIAEKMKQAVRFINASVFIGKSEVAATA